MKKEELEKYLASDSAVINYEIRHLTVELMKIAAARKISFAKVASEFFQNAHDLKFALVGFQSEGETGSKK